MIMLKKLRLLQVECTEIINFNLKNSQNESNKRKNIYRKLKLVQNMQLIYEQVS
jgi:hypothetical protein